MCVGYFVLVTPLSIEREVSYVYIRFMDEATLNLLNLIYSYKSLGPVNK